MEVTFGVPFNLVRCEKCGGARPAEAPCPHCGSTVMYADPELDQRRAIVASVRPILDQPGASSRLSIGEILDGLTAWSNTILPATKAVAEKHDDASRSAMAAVLTRFRDLATSAHAAHRQRELTKAWAAIDASLVSLRGSVDAYLDALSATTPEDATRFGAQGQRGLDAAGEVMGAFAASSAAGRANPQGQGVLKGFLLGLLGGALWRRR